MNLNIANHNALQLPIDFVTERIAFLSRTGAGKSGGMRVLAKEMIRAGQFVVIVSCVLSVASPGHAHLVHHGTNKRAPRRPGCWRHQNDCEAAEVYLTACN